METAELEKALIENLQEKTAKESGKSSQLSVIKSMYRKKDTKRFSGFSEYAGNYVFSDNHRMFICKNDLGFEELKSPLNVKPYIEYDLSNAEKLEIDINDVKKFIASTKGVKNATYIFYSAAGKRCGANPQYILDAVKFSGSNIFYCNIKTSLTNDCNIKPYVQINPDGSINNLCLPVSLPKIT